MDFEDEYLIFSFHGGHILCVTHLKSPEHDTWVFPRIKAAVSLKAILQSRKSNFHLFNNFTYPGLAQVLGLKASNHDLDLQNRTISVSKKYQRFSQQGVWLTWNIPIN